MARADYSDTENTAAAVENIKAVGGRVRGFVIDNLNYKKSGRYGYGRYGRYGKYGTYRPARVQTSKVERTDHE